MPIFIHFLFKKMSLKLKQNTQRTTIFSIIKLFLFLFYIEIPLILAASDGILFPIAPQSPVPSFLNPTCHKSEYQFAYKYKKHKTLKNFLFSGDDVNREELLPNELRDLKYQKIKLLHPTEAFPNHPRTIYFFNHKI